MVFRKIVFLLIVNCVAGFAQGQSFKILTYNIRYDNPGDGVNSWQNRREWLCEQVKQVSPGLFGIQEGLYSQIQYLDSVYLYTH